MIFKSSGQVQAQHFEPIHYQDPKGLAGIGKEFDSVSTWKTISRMIRLCLRKAKCSAKDIVGVSATSQRHGAVFLDKDGEVVYSGPNLDARGVLVQDSVIQQLKEVCPPTGCWPPLLYSLCRLLWFKNQRPEQYERIRHVISISDWIVFCLTDEVSTDPSQASNTQFMDIRSSTWSSEILDAADIPAHLLPTIREPGSVAGTITSEASKETGLKVGTPVGIGGADTQCALLGSATITPGATCVVAGNTAPIQLVTDRPIIDPECRIWTGRHLLPNHWVLEANSGTTGSVLSWFVHNIATPALSRRAKSADHFIQLEQLAASAEIGSLDTIALLGPQVMDASEMTIVRPALFLFPPPASPVIKPISFKDLVRALFENICYAIFANLELLQSISEITLKRCTVVGGLARGQFLRQMIADVTGLEILSTKVFEASSLGAAICAASAAGIYDSLSEGIEKMVTFLPSLEPDDEKHRKYETHFTRWKTLYKQSVNL